MTKSSLLLKSRKPTVGDVAGLFLLGVVFALLFTAAAAGVTMLIFNVIHFSVSGLSGVPAFGYWDSFVLTYAVGWLGFLFKGVDFNSK